MADDRRNALEATVADTTAMVRACLRRDDAGLVDMCRTLSDEERHAVLHLLLTSYAASIVTLAAFMRTTPDALFTDSVRRYRPRG